MEKEKTLSSNKKLIITIVALCVALITVVGALIGVYAASTQSFKSQFNVTYDVSTNIAAKITATYQVGNGTVKSMTTDGKTAAEDGSNAELIFNANTSNTTPGALSVPEDIKLDTTNTSVTFVFSFENIGANPFSVESEWYMSDSEPELFKNILATASVKTTFEKQGHFTDTLIENFDNIDLGKYLRLDVQPGLTDTFEITFFVNNINYEAYIRTSNEDGSINRPLDFILTRSEPIIV